MRNKKISKRSLMWLTLVMGVLLTVASAVAGPRLRRLEPAQPRLVPLSTLYQGIVDDTRTGHADAISIEPEQVLATTRAGREAAWTGGNDITSELRSRFNDAGLPFDRLQIQYQQPPSPASRMLWYLLPALLLIAVLVYVTQRTGAMSNRAFSFGRSRARRFQGSKSNVTLDDVAGVDEAKQELGEIVEFLKAPERFAALGARIPRGVLLVGPPGTGKTLLSRAIAGEADVPFFSISGSEFVEMFVGVGASRVRDLFAEARKAAPCIVFVDEIDAVGRKRGPGPGGGAHEEREQTLNQILVEMDGFDGNTKVIVVAATNRADVLDPALLRPGRFDRQVTLDSPDVRGRQAILQIHAHGKPLDGSVSLETIAKQTPGFSGADLSNVLNEAAILAARREQTAIDMSDLEEAVDRVVGGPARKSRIMSAKEKAITAYHEAGHAIVGRSLPNCDPVHKVSIVSRGRMGGYTRFLPDEDRSYWSKSQFVDNLAALLGGQVAEELTFGESTTGPSNDLERATQIARSMVCDYGMSASVGPVAYGSDPAGSQARMSEMSAEAIDREVQRLIAQAQGAARDTLRANRDRLARIAERLIEEETLSAEQFEALFTGQPAPEAGWSGTEAVPVIVPASELRPAPTPRRAAAPIPAAAAAIARDPFAKGRKAALRRVAARTPRLPRLARTDDDSLAAAAD